MNFEIKSCITSVEGWCSIHEFGLFIDGFLISAFRKGDTFEANIDTILKNGISSLSMTLKINHEISIKTKERTPDNVVYDMYFNGLHVSRFAQYSNVYQNAFKIFKLTEIK